MTGRRDRGRVPKGPMARVCSGSPLLQALRARGMAESLLAGCAAVAATLMLVGCGASPMARSQQGEPSDDSGAPEIVSGNRPDPEAGAADVPVGPARGPLQADGTADVVEGPTTPAEVAEPDESPRPPAAAPSEVRFDDIAGDPREREIIEGVRRGIIEGNGDGRFVPQGTVTRELYAAMIYSVLDVFGVDVAAVSPAGRSSDVEPTRWSARAIGVLNQLGIMGEVSLGRFDPAGPLTRAQAAVAVFGLVQHGLHLRQPSQSAPAIPEIVPRRSYTDLGSHWAAQRIVSVSGFCRADQGGDVGGPAFGPDRLSTRSHAIGVLVRALVCFETGRMPDWAKPLPEAPAEPVTDQQVLGLCETTDPSRRRALLHDLGNLPYGERPYDLAAWGRSHEACVLGLLPAALYSNLRTGVPASILIGQAIQETGWCRSLLARTGLNFHGQKAKFDRSYFRYWDGRTIQIDSSESPTGGGQVQRSTFMRFAHPDFGFYAVPERFLVPGLPYRSCMSRRADPVAFIQCVGQYWAVHRDYAAHVLDHRATFRAPSRPNLRLPLCDLKPDEWAVDSGF